MSQLSALSFEEYVQQVLAEHKGERVYHFTYNDKDFWLKQPEQLHGVWHFLKPKPKQAFKNEIQSLQYLAEHQAPVPHLEMFGEDFLVLEDGGNSVAHWMGLHLSEQQKRAILLDAAVALATLHQQGLVHGRPELRARLRVARCSTGNRVLLLTRPMRPMMEVTSSGSPRIAPRTTMPLPAAVM